MSMYIGSIALEKEYFLYERFVALKEGWEIVGVGKEWTKLHIYSIVS
jgi:hypothetical protein